MQTVFSNHMTAHVWAQLAQNEGRSNNGQFYFDGPTLYSYGAHFVAGYIVPTAPNGDAPTRALSTFINGDSYSVTTGRHLSHAHGAATGAAYAIPGLTELQREIHAHVWPSAYPCESGPQGFRRPAPMKARREALPAIRRHFAAQPAAPSAMAALLRGMGATGAESARWALMAERAHAKAEKERAARELARDRAAAAKDARALAARPVSDTRDKMRADMDSTWFRAERAESEWRDTGRRMFRAKKEALRRGWAKVAAACEGHRKAIFATIPEFRAREIYNARRAVVADYAGEIRAADPTGAADSSAYWEAARAASRLAEFEWFTARARFMGHAHAGANLVALSCRLKRLHAAALARELRAKAREALAQIREARAAAALPISDAIPVPEVARRLTALNAGQNVARKYSGGGNMESRVFRVAGIGAPEFKALADTFKNRADVLRLAKGEAIRELARAEWREAGEVTPETLRAAKDCGGAINPGYGNSYMWGRQLDDGAEKPGALLRATGVERDESEAVIGGELVTSQYARVPLAHAIRVFKFLKRQREAGQEWRANGKTLPVGHFRVEHVTPEGSFKAGCHWVNWGEVARLAEGLGLADLAADDTTESRAHA